MKTYEEQRLVNFGEAIDALMTADIHSSGLIKDTYEIMSAKLGEPLSTFAAKGLLTAMKPDAVVLIGTGFLIKPTLKPETDGPVGAVLLARAAAILGGIPVIVAEKECMHMLTVACRAGEMHVVASVEEAKRIPRSVVLVPLPPARLEKEAAAAVEALLDLAPAAVVSIEHPGKADDGKYYSGLAYELRDWPAPVDDLLELARRRDIFTIGIGDLGNEAGMGYGRPEILKVVPYGDRIVVRGSCDAPIIATISEFGAYALHAALTVISGKEVLPSPDLQEAVLRASVTGGAICGCTGIPALSIDMVDYKYVRAYITMLECAVEYSEKYPASRPYVVDYRRGAPLDEPSAGRGGHGR